MAKILYDPRCETLARVFLDDQGTPYSEDHVRQLAGVIQRAIEDWLEVT
jgi:hypothetical protein